MMINNNTAVIVISALALILVGITVCFFVRRAINTHLKNKRFFKRLASDALRNKSSEGGKAMAALRKNKAKYSKK